MPRTPLIVIHGGTHKTGTSALQNLLAASRPLLADNGILYPNLGRAQHGFALKVRDPEWNAQIWREQAEFAHRENFHTMLLSAELLCTYSQAEFETLFRCFSGFDIRCIFSFRHWCDFLPSRWAQDCRRRDSHSFRSYLRKLQERSEPHADADYAAILSRAAASFEGEVVAVSYDNALRRGLQPVGLVLTAAGFPETLISALLPQLSQVNVRVDWALTELNRLLNGVLANHLKLRQDDLFRARGSSRRVDRCFDLLKKRRRFNVSTIEALLSRIRANAVHLPLRSDDTDIRKLNDAFERYAKPLVTNSIGDRIFFGEFESITTCTDLSWEDIALDASPEIRRLYPAS
jgi:hypothetical protein